MIFANGMLIYSHLHSSPIFNNLFVSGNCWNCFANDNIVTANWISNKGTKDQRNKEDIHTTDSIKPTFHDSNETFCDWVINLDFLFLECHITI